MESNRVNLGVMAILLVLLASPSFAQAPGPRENLEPGPPVMKESDRVTEESRGEASAEERARHFEAKKRERLLNALRLDDATRAMLSRRLEQLDQKGEELRDQRHEALKVLREQARSLRKEMRRSQRRESQRKPDEAATAQVQPDDSALRQTLDRVYAVEDAMAGLRRERLHVGRDLLTPEQQVKFLLSTVRFQKEMRGRLQKARDRRAGGSQDQRRQP